MTFDEVMAEDSGLNEAAVKSDPKIVLSRAAATEFGTDEAILIHHFQYWINHNLSENKNLHDGRTWTYQTCTALAAWFPFFSRSKIHRLLAELVKKGVLLKGNYNHTGYDRTIWYAFADETRWVNSSPDPKPRDIHVPTLGYGCPEAGTPIPDKTKDKTKRGGNPLTPLASHPPKKKRECWEEIAQQGGYLPEGMSIDDIPHRLRDERLREAWNRWVLWRQFEQGKKVTVTGSRTKFKQFLNFNDPHGAIEYSMAMEYTGIFEKNVTRTKQDKQQAFADNVSDFLANSPGRNHQRE